MKNQNKMEFTAHVEGKRIQTVLEHSRKTAEKAAYYGENIGLKNCARIQGLFHDLGKMCKDFDNYINGRNTVRRGEIDHAFAGAKYLWEFVDNIKLKSAEQTVAFIARTIISHHGLHDWIDGNGEWYFEKRLSKEERYEEISSYATDIVSKEELLDLLKKATDEYLVIDKKCRELSDRSYQKYFFYSGLLERLMESILVDADRTDTADFENNQSTEFVTDLSRVWLDMNEKLKEKYSGFAEKKDRISKQRTAIADRCLLFADHKVGICRLVVPTGGGKTLSSLRFAVKYCKEYGKERIFYIAPFMSILEQNSDVIQEIAGQENFLEHYSDFVQDMKEEELAEYELRTEKWDMPVISTTLVQFLNTIFSDRIASLRRFHRLSNSVVIIDEVQAIPVKCISLFNLAMNFLSNVCGATIILCTATQPCLEKTEFSIKLDKIENMNPRFEEDFIAFYRTNLISKCRKELYNCQEAAEFCKERFLEEGSLLLVVNTKKVAADIYDILRQYYEGTNVRVMHLTSGMCPEHRRKELEQICKILNNNQEKQKDNKIICITTSLIEAGVDISFPCVVRSLAGLDNAAQAAGRCNRHGEYPVCNVYIINIKDENLKNLPEIKQRQCVTQSVIDRAKYKNLLEIGVMDDYFEQYYSEQKKYLNYCVKVEENKTTLVDLLSINSFRNDLRNCKPQIGMQAFKTAGNLFRVIDAQTEEIIVPYDKCAKELILELNSDQSSYEMMKKLRSAQKYIVSIYSNQKKVLENAGAVYTLKCGILALKEEFYDSESIGINFVGRNLDVLIF